MKKLFIPPVFVLFSLILIVMFYFFASGLNIIFFPFNLTGIIIAFGGFVLMDKARDLFKKYNTTLDFETTVHLIDEGVFSKSRNPMYVGMFLLLLGISVCFENIISICIPFVFIILVGIYFIPWGGNRWVFLFFYNFNSLFFLKGTIYIIPSGFNSRS